MQQGHLTTIFFNDKIYFIILHLYKFKERSVWLFKLLNISYKEYMLNICIVMPRFFPVPAVRGGAVEQLATFLADESEKNYKINLTFVSVYDELAIEASKKYKNSKFIYIPVVLKEEKYDYSAADDVLAEYMHNVEKAIEKEKFDYVIIQGGRKEHIIPSIPLEKRITYLHGPKIEKGLHKYYKAVMVVSHFIANLYKKESDIPKECVIPLENAIHLEDFSKEISEKEKHELREKYNISEEDIVIDFCGRTIAEKGIKELIQAFKQMRNIQKCKLIIMGNCNYAKQVKTPFEEELFELAEDMKDRIIFTGFMPNKELYKIHHISDVAVIPSMFEEPFGLTVIEAMASGLPLITSDAGAIPDIVDNKNAIIVKRDNNFVANLSIALDKLVCDKELRKIMGKHSEKLVQDYDTPNYYDNFCKIFYDMGKN